MRLRKVKTLEDMIVCGIIMNKDGEPYGLSITEGWRGLLGREWMTDGTIIRIGDREYHLIEEMFYT